MKPSLFYASLAVTGIIVALVVTYASQTSMLYLQADEVFARLDKEAQGLTAKEHRLVGQFFRIHGKLKPKTTRRFQGRLDYAFEIMDPKSGRSLPVRYQGILPDTFRDDAELVLEGKLESLQLFQAYSVFAKCPTKYQDEDPKKHPKDIKKGVSLLR